jgi:glycosyltransferase involved in cell wall biosynthesis
MRSPKQTPATLGLVQMKNGTAAWRVFYPMDYLHARGYPVAYGMNGDPDTSTMIDQADLVVMHRLAWRPEDQGKALEWRRILHANNKAMCYEVDDDILTPAIIERIHHTNLGDYTDEQIDSERRQHLFAIQLCDGVIVSTERLAEICREVTDRPVIVVPNSLDVHRFQLILGIEPKEPPEAPPTIAWIGGNRPDRDAEALGVAWNRISRAYPGVRFRVGGFPLSALVNSVPPGRVDYIPWRPIEAYPRTFANIDIGCAPLNDEPFNWGKSEIKAYEYAAAGAAVCVSSVTYGDLIRHGETGMVCTTADEWTSALAFLLDNPDLRRRMASTLFQEVQGKYSLSANAWRWPEAWNQVVSDFRMRVISSKRGGGSTLPRRMEYDIVSNPVLRV